MLQMASLFFLSPCLRNSLKGVNPLIPRAPARPVVVEFPLLLHSDRSFHHHRSLPQAHLGSPLRALPLTKSEPQINLDDSTRTRVPQDAMEPSMQRSPSPPGANDRFLRHDDSGVRIPDEDEVQVVELPPVYSPE